MDNKKIECILSWLIRINAKAFRGFFGLIGYYRRSIKNYGFICKPLTKLLKKEGFQWTKKAKSTLHSSKK